MKTRKKRSYPTYMKAEIVDETEVCAYCGSEVGFSYRGCCGEVHYEPLYTFADGEQLTESEVIIVDNLPTGVMNEQIQNR
jgi:hypothetical protein